MRPCAIVVPCVFYIVVFVVQSSVFARDTIAEAYVEGGRRALIENQLEVAEKLFDLAIDELAESESDDLLPVALLGAGDTKTRLGQFEAAGKLYRLSVRFTDIQDEINTECCAAALNGLCTVKAELKELHESEALGQKAANLLLEVQTENHLLLSAVLNNLAMVKLSLGKYESAKELAEKASELLDQFAGAEHPQHFQIFDTLAQIHHASGDQDTALSFAVTAQQNAERHHGADSVPVANALETLGRIHKESGNHADAERVLRTANDIYVRKAPLGHPSHFRSKQHLDSVLQSPVKPDDSPQPSDGIKSKSTSPE